jgi:hypothetical protein
VNVARASPTGGVDWRESHAGDRARAQSGLQKSRRPNGRSLRKKKRNDLLSVIRGGTRFPRVAMGCACSAPADDFDDAFDPEAFTGPSRTMLARPKVRRAGTPGVFS